MDEQVLMFFQQDPEALPLYEKFERLVLERVPEAAVKARKSQISFSNRHMFACISFLKIRRAKDRPPHYIVVTFGLDHRLASPRIDGAVEPYPNRWTHHVLISSPDEIDDELMDWVVQASVFSALK